MNEVLDNDPHEETHVDILAKLADFLLILTITSEHKNLFQIKKGI